MLTTGVDSGPAFKGTGGNDTYTAIIDGTTGAVASTLTPLDSIDGAGGTNTLVLEILNGVGAAGTAVAALPNVTVANIQNVNIRSAVGLTADVSTWTGVTTANVTQGTAVALTAAATTDVNISGVAAATSTVAVTGGKNVTVNHKLDSAGDAVAVNGAVDVTVVATDVINAAGINVGLITANTGAISVTSTGAKIVGGTGAVAMDAIAVTGGTTISVTQAATADMGDVATKGVIGDVVTQGGVTVTGGNTTTTVNVVQGDQVGPVAAQAAAGAKQTQTVTFKALVAGNTVTVNGLTFTAAVNLTAEQAAQAFADLLSGDRQDDGGPTANGIYTGINTAGFTTSAAVGATVTYTEVVAGTNTALAAPVAAKGTGTTVPTAPTLTAGIAGVTEKLAITGVLGVVNGAVVVDDNATKSITTITVDGYASATLGAAAGTGSLDALTTLTLKNSGAGIAALTTASVGSLTLNLDDVDGAVGLGATLKGLTINTTGGASNGVVTAGGATTVTINAEAALFGGVSFAKATAIDVNGSAYVNLTGATAADATLKTIDASDNTGGVTAVLLPANTVKFTGGKGNDSLTLGAAAIAVGNDIDMGDGDDTLTLAAGTTAATILATVKGGIGTDTLAMGYTDAVAVSTNAALHAKVEGFERLTIKGVANNGDAAADTFTVNLANLAYNYVTVEGTDDASNTPDILALTGMAANGTVAFGAGTGSDLYTVALADDTAGTDVLNFILASTNETSGENPPVADTTLGTANNAGKITANAVETFNVKSTAVDPDGATNVITANGDAVTTINLSGNAGVNLGNAGTTLKTVDASGLTGTGVAGGLVFTALNANMTVSGGAGNDAITIAATADGGTFNGNGGNDTFSIAAAADLVTIKGGAGADNFVFAGVSTNKSNYAVIDGVNSGDTFELAALISIAPSTFNATKITLSAGATESTQAYLDQAMTTLALNGAGWFQYGGNTFIAADVGGAGKDSLTAFVDGEDFVVMITGLVDLSTASFNATSSTLEIA